MDVNTNGAVRSGHDILRDRIAAALATNCCGAPEDHQVDANTVLAALGLNDMTRVAPGVLNALVEAASTGTPND